MIFAAACDQRVKVPGNEPKGLQKAGAIDLR